MSYPITAELEIPPSGAEGVLLSQAGQGGGWSLYVKDGKPKYAYDGGGLHKGATGTLYVNGIKVGEGRIAHTMGAIYSLAGEGADVGLDQFSPVTHDYDPWDNQFTGKIQKITVQLKD